MAPGVSDGGPGSSASWEKRFEDREGSERNFKGMCKQIDHFPEETDYEADPSEYFLLAFIADRSEDLELDQRMLRFHGNCQGCVSVATSAAAAASAAV
uniref:Uncharacterized protein n=1 Tax=Knipowitschia caucasica TaxID=637954 RepID=A0AAV2KG14_KNICA